MSEKYYELYKFYKNKYEELAKEMQIIINRCQYLLGSLNCNNEQGLDEQQAVMTSPSTSKAPSTTGSQDDYAAMVEAGGYNSWECFENDEERKKAEERLLCEINREVTPKKMFSYNRNSVDIPPSLSQGDNVHRNILMELNTKVTPTKIASSDILPTPPSASSSDSADWLDSPKKVDGKENNKRELDDHHICKLPRCEDHQPFYATAREIGKLSPKRKRLATNQRENTQVDLFNLDIDKITARINKNNKKKDLLSD